MKDFYKELADYLDRDYSLVKARCQYAFTEIAWQWPQYKMQPTQLYKTTDLYLFDLTYYQSLLQESGWHTWLETLLKNSPHIQKVLDFGGGIGEATIIAAEKGLDVSYLDVEGSKTMEYAKHRFQKYNVSPKILTERDSLEKYDLIIAKDVLEHIENSDTVLKTFAEKTHYLICKIEDLPYNEFYPEHISHPDPSPYFEQSLANNELWRSKEY